MIIFSYNQLTSLYAEINLRGTSNFSPPPSSFYQVYITSHIKLESYLVFYQRIIRSKYNVGVGYSAKLPFKYGMSAYVVKSCWGEQLKILVSLLYI